MTPTEAARQDRIAALQARVADLKARNQALEARRDDTNTEAEPSTLPSIGEGTATTNETLAVTLSARFQSESVVIATDHTPAEIQVRRDHDHIRLEALEATDRTVEAVLRGSPAAMTAIADRLYAAAAEQATTEAGEYNG